MMFCLIALAPVGHTYFVSPTGDDAFDGQSRAKAWRTLAKVSQRHYGPGDRIVFASAATFRGQIDLKGAGTKERPIRVSSEGKPATIVSPEGTAVTVRGGGIEIRDLILRGEAKAKKDGHDGLLLVAPGGKVQRYLRIERLDVSGFGGDGVSIKGAKDSKEGFADLRMSQVRAHGNYGAGITSSDGVAYLSKGYAHRDFSIVDCDVSHNLSGTGMVLSGVDGALVEFCRASANRGAGGAVGMWAWCARRVVFRHCIASATSTQGGDGGGFDLDGGCVECVVEKCLSYDNDGPGTMHCDYPAAPRTERNVVRDSISVDDGRKAKGDAIGFGLVTWGSGLYDCVIERNLVVLTVPDPQRRENGLLFVTYIRSTNDPVEKQVVRGCVFRDNVVRTDGDGVAFFRSNLPRREKGDLIFDGNSYAGNAPFIDLARRFGLADWRKEEPKDGRSGAGKSLPDVRKLAPRDLPGFFR